MAHPVDLHVGKTIAARRKALGLSQAEVAKGVGITFQQLQKYERGVNRVSASRLFDICELLALPVAAAFPDQTLAGMAGSAASNVGATSAG